jgi:hypothetical protein
VKTQDQLLLEQAYQRIRISESDLALSVKQSGSLEDFLKNFEGMTLKEFKDKESYYSLYQLNKHNGYADKDTPEGLLTDLIFTLGHMVNQNMFLDTMESFRKELDRKYNLSEVENRRQELNKTVMRIKYSKDLPEEEKSQALASAEKELKDFLDKEGKSYNRYRDEENQKMRELDSQRITAGDLLPNKHWSLESLEQFEKLKEIFNRLTNS